MGGGRTARGALVRGVHGTACTGRHAGRIGPRCGGVWVRRLCCYRAQAVLLSDVAEGFTLQQLVNEHRRAARPMEEAGIPGR